MNQNLGIAIIFFIVCILVGTIIINGWIKYLKDLKNTERLETKKGTLHRRKDKILKEYYRRTKILGWFYIISASIIIFIGIIFLSSVL